ncbi:hypothetical protein HY838_02200 [Candidatus Azambacteria bacterium]|nr:hypothetical protein [Candidatus Azambacteria bacterium]
MANYQKIWAKFKIDKNGMYKKISTFDALNIEEPTGDSNLHLCLKHEKDWREGKI